MKKASRKNIMAIMYANRTELAPAFAKALKCTEGEFIETITDWAYSMHRPTAQVPSYETIRNAQTMTYLAQIVNDMGREVTASELAATVTDEDGYPMSSRRVGGLLKRACKSGYLSMSPEPWPVGHYGPLGFEDWARKPSRRKQVNIEDLYED